MSDLEAEVARLNNIGGSIINKVVATAISKEVYALTLMATDLVLSSFRSVQVHRPPAGHYLENRLGNQKRQRPFVHLMRSFVHGRVTYVRNSENLEIGSIIRQVIDKAINKGEIIVAPD